MTKMDDDARVAKLKEILDPYIRIYTEYPAYLDVDEEAHVAYLDVQSALIDRTVSVTVNVDLSPAGKIVGIEFLDWPLV